jgi:uncharacterized LabA/DUF88 family protein
MQRYGIFLDAGYFFAAGAHAVTGRQKTPRKQITLKAPEKAVDALCTVAGAQTGMSLLRLYWYDAAAGSRPSLEQSTLAMLPRVKLRLGVLNNVGEQKGVDSLIVTDLIELARNRGIADAVIVSGDEDLRVAVQVAQSFGVRVHLLAAGDPKNNVSTSLQMECDSVAALPATWFSEHLVIVPGQATAALAGAAMSAARPAARAAAADSLDEVAKQVSEDLLSKATSPQLAGLKAHFTAANSVPPDFDRRLIAMTASRLGGAQLTGDQMRHVRGIFVRCVRAMP